MPRNDGSEELELLHSNISKIAILNSRINLAQSQSTDAYRQLGDSLSLLGECRDLLELIMDHQLHKDITDLICKIDEFYPQGG